MIPANFPQEDVLTASEMATWHLLLIACQTLDDVADFCTALDTLAPLQRTLFDSSVPDTRWAWLFNLPEAQAPELDLQQLEPKEPVSPTLDELRAKLLACDTLAALNQSKRTHKKAIAKAYHALNEFEQAHVDALAALTVPHKVFKYVGEQIGQGTERLKRGTLVYLDPAAQVRSSAVTAPVWSINGVASGWVRPVEVSFCQLREVVKLVLPDNQDGGQLRGLQ